MTEPDILPLGSKDSSVETWSSKVSTVKVQTHTAAEKVPLKADSEKMQPARQKSSAPKASLPKKEDRGPKKEEIHPEEVVQGLGLKLSFDQIPDKLEFKIGEVAELLGVKAYVLRFWETEFDALQPEKARNNQRVYAQKDVKLALLIKHLLYAEKYSIEGARAALVKARKKAKTQAKFQVALESHKEVRQSLEEILLNLRALRELFR